MGAVQALDLTLTVPTVPMVAPQVLTALVEELRAVPGLDLLQGANDLLRYSSDAYDYSPVLSPLLERCKADLVVRPRQHARLLAYALSKARRNCNTVAAAALSVYTTIQRQEWADGSS